VNLELGHDFSKNIVFAQAYIGTGETLVSFVIYDQKTAFMRVNGKGPLLVSFIVDTNYSSPKLMRIAAGGTPRIPLHERKYSCSTGIYKTSRHRHRETMTNDEKPRDNG
jgi:hypothetical protein